MVVNEDYHTLVFWKTPQFCFFADHNTSDVPTSSLPLLFLIPAALILVPVISWVCCRWKQHRRRNWPSPHCQHDAVITIRREHHKNNPGHKQQRCNDNGYKYTSVTSTRQCGSNERETNSSHLQYVQCCVFYLPQFVILSLPTCCLSHPLFFLQIVYGLNNCDIWAQCW